MCPGEWPYTKPMGFSLSRRKPLDVTGVGLTLADLPKPDPTGAVLPLDFDGWFDPDLRGRPLELEIGTGKGTFLVQTTQAQGGTRQANLDQFIQANYIGIEWARAFWRYAADRVRRHRFRHIRLIHAEAGAFVRQYCGDQVFQTVHIYFPDPWPKARHHKRRLIQTPFLRQLHRVLKPGGCVRLTTDHDDYFAWMQAHAAQVADLFRVEPFEPGWSPHGELVGTNFERKYRQQGRTFHAMMLRKIVNESPAPGTMVAVPRPGWLE